jgi:hypothetical protein
VLGVGGWVAGVLAVLIWFPTVPLDDVLLGVLSIGVPVALGVYLAWVDKSLSVGARTTAFWAVTAGALAGAWLGYHSATGLLAVVTTAVGATLGANAILLFLDIARQPAAAPVVEVAQPVLTS